MQQHGGRPQGECPSHWLSKRAIHQLPATLVTTNPQRGKWPARKTYGTGSLFRPKPRNQNVELLVLFNIDSYLGLCAKQLHS